MYELFAEMKEHGVTRRKWNFYKSIYDHEESWILLHAYFQDNTRTGEWKQTWDKNAFLLCL